MNILGFFSEEVQKRKYDKRRFFALENRTGIARGVVDEYTQVRYYLDKSKRSEGSSIVGDFEAKSSKDDRTTKFLTTLPGYVLLMLIFSSVYTDELREALGYNVNGTLLWALFAIAVTSVILFLVLNMHFERMEKAWENSLSGIFDSSIVNVMNDVVKCMREFKRYVKWRRFMEFMVTLIWVGLFFVFGFVAVVSIKPSLGIEVSRSEATLLSGILFLEFCWMFFLLAISKPYTLEGSHASGLHGVKPSGSRIRGPPVICRSIQQYRSPKSPFGSDVYSGG